MLSYIRVSLNDGKQEVHQLLVSPESGVFIVLTIQQIHGEHGKSNAVAGVSSSRELPQY